MQFYEFLFNIILTRSRVAIVENFEIAIRKNALKVNSLKSRLSLLRTVIWAK